jgi:hypothetical protein
LFNQPIQIMRFAWNWSQYAWRNKIVLKTSFSHADAFTIR